MLRVDVFTKLLKKRKRSEKDNMEGSISSSSVSSFRWNIHSSSIKVACLTGDEFRSAAESSAACFTCNRLTVLFSKPMALEELFICTKLWHTYSDPERVILGCQRSLENLNLDYIDLYLIHSPLAAQASDDTLYPKTKDGKPAYSDVDYVCTWIAMEELAKKRLCKSIGISNFNKKQVQRVLDNGRIVPQNHQIEHHPYLTQKELTKFCAANKITITAFAPLGSPNRPWAGKDTPKILLSDPKAKKKLCMSSFIIYFFFLVLDIAKKHDKSPAQVLLRYQIELGHATVPNAGRSEQFLIENINIFDFCLHPDEIAALNSLNADMRYFKFTGAAGHPHHPFETK
uniref:NADP-dependent oxidoreductase domain-containing protein n=1 Tax=Glossina brevipalpis TaxID=37001 RepID=A0A1A9W801_9MUSC